MKHDHFYIIILSVIIYQRGVKIKNYVIVRKPVQKMKEIYEYFRDKENGKTKAGPEPGLVNEDDDVMIFENVGKLRGMKMRGLHRFILEKRSNDKIGLTVQKYVDTKIEQNFIVMIYQESDQTDYNFMLIYDIVKNTICSQVHINPQQKNLKMLHVDNYGFNTFKICRTSQIETVIDPKMGIFAPVKRYVQTAKY